MRALQASELLSLAAGAAGTYRTLNRMPFLSRDEIRAWQFERIRRLVTHAFRQVAFYRELYANAGFQPSDLQTWADFNRLPVVTKDQIIANYPSRMIAADYDLGQLVVSRSSGSSGKVLDIAYDKTALNTFVLAGFRLYRMGFQYRPWHKQMYVYTSPYPLQSLFGLYPMQFVSTLAPAPETAAMLRRERPALLVCYPSHLRQIAALIPAEERRAVGLKLISVNSEMSTQAERDEFERLFGCPVLDEYSSEELTRIAAQCLFNHYHLFEDINYMETLDAAGQAVDGIGILTGTNLHNYAMPLIRYQQNDLGQIEESTCACGWRFRVLRSLEGRRNDSFVMPSGKILSSGFLLDATYEFLLNDRNAVQQFCLIQENRASVLLQVVPSQAWSSEVENRIVRRFHEFLEPAVSFRVVTVAECEGTKTGKRNPIIAASRSESKRLPELPQRTLHLED